MKHCRSVRSKPFSVALHVQVLWSESLPNASGDGLGPGSQITSIAFLPELEALCIAATSGELLLVLTSREVQEARRPLSLLVTQHNIIIAALTEHCHVCRLASSKRASLAVHGALIKSSLQSAPGTGTWSS